MVVRATVIHNDYIMDKPTHEFPDTCGSNMAEKTYKMERLRNLFNEACPTLTSKETIRKKKSEAAVEETVKESKKSSKANERNK